MLSYLLVEFVFWFRDRMSSSTCRPNEVVFTFVGYREDGIQISRVFARSGDTLHQLRKNLTGPLLPAKCHLYRFRDVGLRRYGL